MTMTAPHSPEERRREVAAILAAGILRLRTPLQCIPEPESNSPESMSEKLSESRRNCLDVSASPRPHVSAG